MKIKLKHLCSDEDRHGNVRFYVRVPRQKKIRLSAAPTTEEFYQTYRRAIGERDALGPDGKIKAGSFRELEAKYAEKMNLLVFEPLKLERSWTLATYRSIGGYEVW